MRDQGVQVCRYGGACQRIACRAIREYYDRGTTQATAIGIAGQLNDLRVPPGNRLEAFKGDRAGQHSIRINDQFRLCFRWTDTGAEDVEIADYH
jgi:proteic killer suppression protein